MIFNENKHRFRNVYPRPVYRDSVWYKMIVDGRCKDPALREHQTFKRRFGVSWARFNSLYEQCLDWRIEKVRLDSVILRMHCLPIDLLIF